MGTNDTWAIAESKKSALLVIRGSVSSTPSAQHPGCCRSVDSMVLTFCKLEEVPFDYKTVMVDTLNHLST